LQIYEGLSLKEEGTGQRDRDKDYEEMRKKVVDAVEEYVQKTIISKK
jgi:hypothetical protein